MSRARLTLSILPTKSLKTTICSLLNFLIKYKYRYKINISNNIISTRRIHIVFSEDTLVEAQSITVFAAPNSSKLIQLATVLSVL